MKKLVLKLVLLFICISFAGLHTSYGQEYYDATNTPRQYYYNNLESGNIASSSSWMPNASLTVSANNSIGLTPLGTSSLNGSKSFYTTASSSAIGYLKWNFMGGSSAAGLGLGGATYEWEFDYKNVTGVATADATLNMPVSSSGTTASWRYWLLANSYGTNPNDMLGLFVTVNNGVLKLITKYQTTNITDNGISINIGNNTNTYQFRIVKSVIGYYYIYVLNRNTNTTNSYGPYNLGTSNTIDLNTYNFSYLECSANSVDRFEWDNFNFYRQKVEYIPITSAANGITTALSPGMSNVIPYGINVNIRGDILVGPGRLRFSSNDNTQAIFNDNSSSLYKTTNSVLSLSGATALTTGQGMYSNGTAQLAIPSSEYYYSPGNTNGTTVNVINYFLVTSTRSSYYSSYPSSVTFSVSTGDDDNYHDYYQSGYYPFNTSSNTQGATISTTATAPSVTTAAASNIATTTATLGGAITSIGSANVSSYGVVYSSSNNTPTTADTKQTTTTTVTAPNTFSYSVTSLAANTTYYVRAYAINSVGTTYGPVVTFTTSAGTPTVTTSAASNVAATSATLGGAITSIGSANVSSYGVVYSFSNNTPTTADSKQTTTATVTGANTFSYSVSSLAPNTTYYVRAYAVNSFGTSYGAVVTFTTPTAVGVSVPIDINNAANSVPENSANGTVVGLTAYSYDFAGGYGTTNLALNKTATASSYEDGISTSTTGGYKAANAVDGQTANNTPRWSSLYQDPQWFMVDLGASYDISRVRIFWETALGKDFQIQVSPDGVSNFTTIKTVTGNSSTTNDFTGLSAQTSIGRYVRMYGTARGTGYGYSIYEFEVYGSKITYSLTNDAGGRFAINATTGVVTVANGTLLDYETNTSHTITVQASNGTQTASQSFVINVTDVNEAPVITSNGGGATATIAMTEGSTAVTTVTATDPDNGQTLTYSIAGGTDAAKFNINASTGVLTFKTAPVYSSSGSNSYQVTVQVTDNGSPVLNDQQAITINVSAITGLTVNSPTQCGAGIATLTASGVSPAGGTYNWYTASTGGILLFTSTSGTYTPFVPVTTTYYVSYTINSSTTNRVAATVTVNPRVGSSISIPALMYPFSGNSSDISGTGNDAQQQNSPTLVADRYGVANSAYSFNGTNQYMYAKNQINNPVSLSISLWFKTTTAGGKLIGFGGNQTGSNATFDRSLYLNNSGQLYWGIYSSGVQYVNTTATYIDGLWHHVVATTGSSGLNLYVDGVLQASNATYTNPQVINGYWRLGYDSLNNWPSPPTNLYFTGILDDIAVYDHELSSTELNATNDLNLYTFSNSFCAGNSLTVTAQNVPGATYSWVDNDDATITATGQSATFAKATTTYYKLTTTVGSCSYTANVTPYNVTFTWTGGAGTTNPATPANWRYSSTAVTGTKAPVFDGTESIIIPGSLSVYPVLTANASIYSLTLSNGATLGLGSFTLSVGCSIYNNNNTTNGILYSNANGGISWNGTGAVQNYIGTNTTYPLQVGKMAVNNSATNAVVNISGGKIDVYNLLDINTASLNVATTGTLTLKSTATQTAAVDVIPSAYKVTGKVNVERYMAGQSSGTSADNTRNYRLLSTPVNVNSVVDNSTGTAFYNLAYLSATGTYTGVFTAGPNGPSAGFTYTNATPTVYLYNEALTPSNATFNSGNFKGITDITGNTVKAYDNGGTVVGGQNATMYSGNGFMLYYVGNNVNNTTSGSPYNKATRAGGAYIAPDASTMTAIGTLNQGSQPVKLWNAASVGLSYAKTHFCLVGNPYASAIDWNTYISQAGMTYTNVGSTIYVFDYTSKNYGTYQAINGGTSGTNNATNIIQSGQGFFVQTTGTSPTLTFKESAKSTTNATYSNPKLMGLPVASAPLQLLRLRLAKDTINRDETIMLFQDEAKNEIEDGIDAYRINGIGNISTLASYAKGNANMLSINHMHSIDSTTRVKLFVNMTSSVGVVDTLSATGFESLDPRYDVFLIDKFKKDSLQISLYKKYNFNITTDTASYGANRFELVFHKKSGLNYRLLSFTGAKVNNTVKLTWKVENEQNLTGFNIEKPDGSKQFVSVYALQSDGKGTYTWIDQAPAIGSNSYRLRQDDPFNVISYSNTISVNFENSIFASEFMTVYPNPTISDMNIKLNMDNIPTQVRMKIYDSTGQLKLNKVTNGNNIQENIGNLLPGVYVVQIFDNVTQNMIGQKKVTKAR